jgi:hypothetical protein
MLPSNPLFHVNVRKLRSRISSLLCQYKIKNLYFSDHFLDRAVERNFDIRDIVLFIMGLVALGDLNKTTFNTTSYKISGKGIFVLAKVCVGDISKKRYLTVKTCYDSDVFDDTKYDVALKF